MLPKKQGKERGLIMSRKLKHVSAILLAVLMLITLMPAYAESGTEMDYPDYLNLDSVIPIVKEGETSPTLKIVMVQDAGAGSWDDLWISDFFSKALNINVEVEQILTAAKAERLNLMFMANDLPDIIMNMGISANDIYKYGALEGQLLKLDEYINETLTPNIVEWFERAPEAEIYSTTPDGHIYCLPQIMVPEPGALTPRVEYNQSWLTELGIEMPTTVDEMLDMLYAFKENDLGGTGNPIPLAAGYKTASVNPGKILLAAIGGYATRGDAIGLDPVMRNGEVFLPVNDPTYYLEYLKVMNQLYTDGLIPENYFTIELNEVNALAAGGQAGMYPDVIHVSGVADWSEWTYAVPLTSELNSEKVIGEPPAITTGGFVVSAKTEYPELAMRLADAFFTVYGRVMYNGVGREGELAEAYTYDHLLPYMDTVTNTMVLDEGDYPEGITGAYNYLVSQVSVHWKFGPFDHKEVIGEYTELLGGSYVDWPEAWNPAEPGGYARVELYEKVYPYMVATFPTIYYVDEDTQIAMSDLSVVLKSYIEGQYALFVTGQRSLDEFDTFMTEIKNMGIDEYEQYFRDIYAQMMT